MQSSRLTRHAAILAASLAGAARPSTRALAVVTVVCAALAPSPALAQSDTYKQRMERGVKLFQDSNFEAAIVEFRAAYNVRPKASPLLNIALCYKSIFNYPKAIVALETALAKHSDTMDAADRKAAEEAIAEMRDLLAYVTITVSPAHATLTLDDEELPAGSTSRPLPLGPGTHRVRARAEGYASAEQQFSVASGEKDRKVALALVADKGFVTIRAGDPELAIAVDQQPLGYGEWSGFLTPGAHLVQIYAPGKKTYSVQVIVGAGTKQEIRPGVGGVPITLATTPPAPKVLVIPPKPLVATTPSRGWFALATASLLVPFSHPKDMPEADTNSGGAGGFRVGYRVNVPASFDFLFEYGNVYTTNERAPGKTDTPPTGDVGYTLSSFRFGLNLRLMTPGRSARFVGSIGGGLVHDTISYSLENNASCLCREAEGVDPFLHGDVGFELDFGGVLVGAALQTYFQSSRGIKTEDGALAYASAPLVHLGGGLRVGYAAW